ncbi:unnamed protein product [Calypogeia fissa]
MELVRALDRRPPSWRTETGARLLVDRATTSLSSSSSSSSSSPSLTSTSTSTSTSSSSSPFASSTAQLRQHNISVQRAPLQDFFSFASSIPIDSRTSVEAMLQGTRIRMLEMRLKMQHKFPRLKSQGNNLDHGGLIGLTAATDLNRRHRVTLESTLGSDEDRQSMSTFVSSKFESRISWGLAISHKVHRTITFFSRYNSDNFARNQFIVQVVHKMNRKTTLSPIFSVSTGSHPQAGFSLTRQLTEIGFFGNNSLQVKGFYSGGGAYSVSIKAQAGQVDGL